MVDTLEMELENLKKIKVKKMEPDVTMGHNSYKIP
jgi:hypothetical protein